MKREPEIVTIIQDMLKGSRKDWEDIINSTSNEPYIGLKQTVARSLYEGRIDETMKLIDFCKMRRVTE